nr:hypothetical protein F511_28714 [Ipomoea trifida]
MEKACLRCRLLSRISQVCYGGLPGTPPESGSSGGLSGGQKAGIVIGVFAAAGAGWVGWRIYKKRRGNIRRARFGYQARSDMQL